MLFLERKTDTGYHYECEDVFGKLTIESESQIDKGTLDDVVVFLLKQNVNAQVLEGKVETKLGNISYRLEKAASWADDDEPEDEPCDDTPTSTPEPESASTPTSPLLTRISSWLRRFVGAFRAAWRSASERSHE